MAKEAVKVIARRFTARMLESGLLVLAVALGVGATAAGFSLLANTQKVGAEMLASPAYREIVVATQTKADDMESPAVLKPSKDNVILTASDLSVAQSVPGVRYAYVSSGTELRFLNQKAITQMASMGPGPGGATPAASTSTTTKSGSTTQTSAPKAASGNGGFRPPSEDDLTKAKAEADVFITDVDQLRGSAVTPQYFSAWGLKAATGSLFADSESQSDTTTLVVLGANAATQIAGTGNDPKTLVGKKILTWEGYASVVGILAVSGTDTIDNSFFTPYQTPAADSGFGPPRRMSFNVQLRFSVSNPSQLEKAAASLSSLLSQTYSTDQLVVSNPRAEAQKLIDRNTGIGVLILFLALAALFIASVNVSHILMSRGLRMRKGVGILMALGASKASVLQLFAGEGVFLSTAGSLLGALLAWPLSQTMESALGLSSSSLVFLAAGVAGAWVLNLVFSILPAVQNSQIPPADAMRAA